MTARLVLLLAFPARALDLAIVGAGPVGTSAALRAAELGKSVALIDAPEFSGALSAADGEDLSFGAPSGLFSKALRDTAKKFSVETLRQMGLDDTSIWDQIKFSCASLARANARAAFLDVESAGVEYIRGKAVLADGGQTVCIDNQRKLAPDNILLCTGSRPFRIPGIPFDGKRIFESDSINTLTYLPKSIAITGSGIVAIEFAQIFASLGAEVTLIVRDQNPARALSKIGLDKDIAAAVLADLKAKKIRTVKGAEAVGFDVPERPRPVVVKLQAPGGGPVKGSGPQELKVDAYLAAVGRKPNTDNLARRRAESSRRPPRHRRVLISVDFPRRASRRPASSSTSTATSPWTARCAAARRSTRSTRRATLLVGHSWHLLVPHKRSRPSARCSRPWATTARSTRGWARRARATTRRRWRRTPSSSRWGSGPRRRSRISACRRSRPIP